MCVLAILEQSKRQLATSSSLLAVNMFNDYFYFYLLLLFLLLLLLCMFFVFVFGYFFYFGFSFAFFLIYKTNHATV